MVTLEILWKFGTSGYTKEPTKEFAFVLTVAFIVTRIAATKWPIKSN